MLASLVLRPISELMELSQKSWVYYLPILSVLWVDSQASCMLGKRSVTELHPKLVSIFDIPTQGPSILSLSQVIDPIQSIWY